VRAKWHGFRFPLGALALLRNLRNMKQAGVNESLVVAGIEAMVCKSVPFRCF
jgi:hypothetical protein